MRSAHDLNVAIATPRIGCDVSISTEQNLPSAYNPHTRITVKIYNEGELAAQSITGQWKYIPNNLPDKRVFEIRRDYLGKCENKTDSYLIENSANPAWKHVRFDVEVEFFYTPIGEQQAQQYRANYYYHPESQRMIKRDYA